MDMKNLILNYFQEFELTDISRDINRIVIEERNDLIGDLKIAGYEHLESIVVKGYSLQNLRSLRITQNPLLKSISFGKKACHNVIQVDISSLR